ncbi:MAG: uroporphyrinogen-III synthase [Planctomycetaceae bacterium]
MRRARRHDVDWIGLSSPSIARNLRRLLPEEVAQTLGHRTRLVAISPVTAQAAAEAGLPVAAVAEEYTWEGIFAAIAATALDGSDVGEARLKATGRAAGRHR